MPWQEYSIMDRRLAFLELAGTPDSNIRALCREFGISPKTGYRWINRAAAAGYGAAEQPCDVQALHAALSDRSRRPHHTPGRSSPAMEAVVVAARQLYPCWGGAKLRVWLGRHGAGANVLPPELAGIALPSASTITAMLHRHGLVDPASSLARRPLRRFEHARPNDLWQMDVLGHKPLGTGRVHALSVVDDHSRAALGLFACADERWHTIQPLLTALFRRHGLPRAILCDNGPPWAVPGQPAALTRLGLWLRRLDIELWHGRPRHPQTQGKVERFHRTVAEEALSDWQYADLATCQQGLDDWRQLYNLQRPHQALNFAVPADRYQDSPRPLPEPLPPLVYPDGAQLRSVRGHGQISYRGRSHYVGEGLIGERVGLVATAQERVLHVYCGPYRVATITV